MIRLIIAVVLLWVIALPGVCGVPDFSWGTDCKQLGLAQEKWNAAAFVLPLKGSQPAQPQPFDCTCIRQVISHKSFNDSVFAMLDDAMRRSRVLEESRKLYYQALEKCKPDDACDLKKAFDEACLELRYHISLATALARAGVARKMADNESSNYCIQGMESAIDTLSAAQKEETDRKRLESLRSLRSRLFTVWEQAQRTRDLKLIRDFDLLGAFDESMAPLTKQAGTQ